MQPSDNPDIQALHAWLEAEVAATEAGDVDTVMALRTGDYVFMGPNRPAIEGAHAVREFNRQTFGAFMCAVSYAFQEVVVSGDLAFARGSAEFAMTPRSGGETISDTGKMLLIFRREPDGSWKLSRTIANSDLAPAAPPDSHHSKDGADEAAITGLVEALSAAEARGDARAAAAYYTEHAVQALRTDVAVGRADIEKRYVQVFADGGIKTRARTTTRLLSPTTALVHGPFEVTHAAPRFEGVKGYTMATLVKEDGQRLVASVQSSVGT